MDAGQLAATLWAALGFGWTVVRFLPTAFPADWKPLLAFTLGFVAAVSVGLVMGADTGAVLVAAIAAAGSPTAAHELARRSVRGVRQ